MRYRSLLSSFLFALFVPALLANCSSGTVQTAAADKPAYAAAPAAGPAVADASARALAAAEPTDTDYRISARDILEVSVFQVPDLSKTVQVSDDGYITLPLIGKTEMRGKTTRDAEQTVASRLRKKYLQSPQVSIFVKQYGQRVTVSGEVKTPRVLAVDGRMTLTQAVASAGGFSDLADTARVHVARSVNGRIHDQVYNFDQIQGGQAVDPSLQGGDLVVAEQSGAKVAFKSIKDMLPFAILASVL